MIIAFPVETDEGIKSRIFTHFGSAPFFLFTDTDTGNVSVIPNQDTKHPKGNCKPVAALTQNPVDCVITTNIGKGALTKLNAAGLKIYKAIKETAEENIDLMNDGILSELTPDQVCGGKDPDGLCAHI